jgi:hypothetical protein
MLQLFKGTGFRRRERGGGRDREREAYRKVSERNHEEALRQSAQARWQ